MTTSTTPATTPADAPAVAAPLTNFAPAELVTMIAEAVAGKLARSTRYMALSFALLATYAVEGKLQEDTVPLDNLLPATDADPAEDVYTDAKGGRWIFRSDRGRVLLGGIAKDHMLAASMKPGKMREVGEKVAAEAAKQEAERIKQEAAKAMADLEAARAELAALKAAQADKPAPAAPKATGRAAAK
ncbi:hypothetical protein Ppa06_57900 [Planomonospora parontospora subsp. parontospora]|uniref:Uncharacterized protein n=2 Tax=Planomonospora parontospora TaxID=58119 RepID=A0AA37BMI5_9ACTN|nr:hypothetical protein [Planomonospora parontospora]GGK90455.1 hypothetical protein GCM10010126_57410 [Planomonospora parontospora]GII11992.1 hypothetical protein Ppa06_57900 [Planomonospora parontospora subsp. parontospora]